MVGCLSGTGATEVGAHAIACPRCAQLADFHCLNLWGLRPAAPVTLGAAAGTGVPALNFHSIHIGSVYEFDALENDKSGGQRAAYVPAVVVRKQLQPAEGGSSPARVRQRAQLRAALQQECAPGAKIAAVLRHLSAVAAGEGPSTEAELDGKGRCMELRLAMPGEPGGLVQAACWPALSGTSSPPWSAGAHPQTCCNQAAPLSTCCPSARRSWQSLTLRCAVCQPGTPAAASGRPRRRCRLGGSWALPVRLAAGCWLHGCMPVRASCCLAWLAAPYCSTSLCVTSSTLLPFCSEATRSSAQAQHPAQPERHTRRAHYQAVAGQPRRRPAHAVKDAAPVPPNQIGTAAVSKVDAHFEAAAAGRHAVCHPHT